MFFTGLAIQLCCTAHRAESRSSSVVFLTHLFRAPVCLHLGVLVSAPAGVTQKEDHTGVFLFVLHQPSVMLA